MRSRKRFGQILLESEAITESDLAKAIGIQKRNGMALGRILEGMGAISDRDTICILAMQFNLKCIDQISRPADTEKLFKLIDCDTAIKMHVFPLSVSERKLTLAVSNPLDLESMDRLAFKTGLVIHPVLATPGEIFKAIKSFYMGRASTTTNLRPRILIIDQHELYRKNIATRLERERFVTLTGKTLEGALKVAIQEPPDLILVDTSTIFTDSRDLYSRLQGISATCGKPVIALTTRLDPDEEAQLLQIGYFDVLGKPIHYTRLLARIQRTLKVFHGDRYNLGQEDAKARSAASQGNTQSFVGSRFNTKNIR